MRGAKFPSFPGSLFKQGVDVRLSIVPRDFRPDGKYRLCETAAIWPALPARLFGFPQSGGSPEDAEVRFQEVQIIF